jgi:TRAP-type C4-dicarboxylate transport system permease large subunit
MKKPMIMPLLALLSFIILGLSSCELIGDIFQAGIWVGVILVVGIIALILWLLRKIF